MAHEVNTEELKENISNRSTWMRFLYMILFVVFITIAEIVLSLLIIVQFGIALLAGKPNEDLRQFLHSVNRYVYDILQFLTFNSEDLPFPFGEWDYDQRSASGATGSTRKKTARGKTGKKKAARKSGG